MTKLTGRPAIEFARSHGLTLNKYADPTEPARTGLSISEAEDVVAQDPSLIWVSAVVLPRPSKAALRNYLVKLQECLASEERARDSWQRLWLEFGPKSETATTYACSRATAHEDECQRLAQKIAEITKELEAMP